VIPKVQLGSTPLRLTQSAGRIDGEYRVRAPSSDADVLLTRVAWSETSGRLVFRIGTSTVPSQVAVLVFDQVPEGVVPTEAQARILDCVKGTGCSVEDGTNDVAVVVASGPVLPAVVVLDVQYATLEPADTESGIATYGASWAARVIET